MADVWFKKLGFGKNPFSIKPAAFSYELFGVNVDVVISGIDDGKVLFVEAPLGYGKTTMLKSIIHRFGGRKKVIYANILPSERVDVKDLLKRSSIANYLTGNLPKEMILVADEAQNILPDASAEIMEFYRSGNIRAVVFFGTSYSQDGFVGEIRAVMDGNIVRLSRPTPEQAISLVRSRIGNLPILPNEIILSAYLRANGSPRRLLQICEDICKAAVEKGRLSVSEQELSELAPAKSAAATKLVKTIRKRRKEKKKISRPRPRRRVVQKAAAYKDVNSINPMAVSSVSSTAAAEIATSVTRQVLQPKTNATISKKATAGKTKKLLRKKQHKNKKAKQPEQPKSSAAAKYAATTKVESTEGVYWGEFMGMQK